MFAGATRAYDEGRYEVALTGFRHAHALTGHPDLLFNIAQSTDRLFRAAEARDAFAAYLAEADPAPDVREAIEIRLAELTEALSPTEPEEAEEPEPEPEVIVSTPLMPAPSAPDEDGGDELIWVGGLIGIGVALAIIGVGIGVGLAVSGPSDFTPDDIGGVVFTLGGS
ncbi:MAG: hypothetical protein AB8I08_22715 [Sandaracinaceae bacterium]